MSLVDGFACHFFQGCHAAATLIKPLRRNVIIPRSIAFFLSSTADAPTRTSSLNPSSHFHYFVKTNRSGLCSQCYCRCCIPFLFESLPSSLLRVKNPLRINAGTGTSTTSVHCLQIRRTRRWAQIRLTEARDEERLDAHVHEAVNRARRVVGVERREHEVPGERRLDGDRAVSPSRISPTRMMLGSCRRNERSTLRRTSGRSTRGPAPD